MRLLFAALSFASILITAAQAQETPPIPDRHIAISRNTDFPGGDIRSIFDTTFDACTRACLTDPTCGAFTFNSRNNSCFPKTGVGERGTYEGALSAIVVAADPAVIARSLTRRAELDFLSENDIAQARSFAADLAKKHYVNDWEAQALIDGATNARAAQNYLNALRFTGSALTLRDLPGLWVDYADDALRITTDNRSEQRDYRQRAKVASINAYLRAENPSLRANALVLLARALERQGRGRDMIPALRLSNSLSPRQDTAEALDDAIGKYGFRIVEHRVDHASDAPRICAEFSENLVPAGVDYAPFVQLPEAGLAVTHQGRELCVEGVTHGQRYRVTFREGIPAASGEVSQKDVDLTLYVKDRPASLRFPGRAYVLPKTGDAALPIVSVNVTEVDLALRRISDRNMLRALQEGYFGRPLSPWEDSSFAGQVAEEIWTGTGEVQMELNRDVTTRLPMDEVIADLPAGIYALRASVPGSDPYESAPATQWFVISDIGLSTLSGTDGLHVFARSLGSAAPMAGLEVTILSRANRALQTVTTDAEGHALFAPGMVLGTGGSAPAMVLAKLGEDDLAFMDLTGPAFDLSDRGVEGRPAAGPVDLFLATDRGAYRAGETIYATALTRDGKAEAIDGLPVTAILTRPDGVEYSRTLSQGGVAGGHVFSMPLSGGVPRGTWTLSLYTDPKAAPLSTRRLLVEDFLPERIDFDLALPDGPMRAGDTPPLSIEARYLFGAPAGDLPIEGEVQVRAAKVLDGYNGYRFGRHDEPVPTRFDFLPGGQRTGADGTARMTVEFPVPENTRKPLEATLTIRVSEGSGRPVERRLTKALTPENPMIGIKPRFDGVVGEGSEAAFDMIALSPDLSPLPMPVTWTLNRVETRYQWYQLYGSWNWEPITRRTRIARGEAMMDGGRLSLSQLVDWGQYELVIEQTNAPFTSASMTFYAGWYAPADASDTPDTLDLSLNADNFAPGETAQLRIVPRYAGEALITVMNDAVISRQAVSLSEGENLIPLEVGEDWGAGAYVTATLIRPANAAEGRNPMRAVGLTYAQVDPGARQLTAGFEVPAESAPRGPLDVALKVDGLSPGDTAYATIAAVDLGILNLTAFKSPDPEGYYFGQRKLGVEMRDVYGRLIDGMNGAMGVVRSGGDADNGLRLQSPPPTEELVAYFSGPIEVGADGYARTSFDIPSFNGTVRLMAIAWSDTGVGQAEADVLVRDPVVVTASLPRFLTPGDQSRLLLEVVHAKGPAGRMGLDVSARGLTLDRGAIPSGIDLAQQGKFELSIPISASEIGVQTIRVALTTPDGRQLIKDLNMPVQVNDPEITRVSRFDLAAGDSFTFSSDVFTGLMPGTGQATLSIGPIARFDAGGLLQALDRYPYGCTEQITSKAMPLLYLDQVAEAMGLATRDKTAERIEQAIAEVLTNQGSGGGFGLWRAGSGDLWLDAYVSDFLSRARAQGYDVPTIAFRNAMDNLRNQVNYASDFDEGGEDLAYALMVLAREGAASMGDLRYYADVKGEDFGTPMAAAQIGAALASYGDQARADRMFTVAARKMAQRTGWTDGPVWRADYGTNRRDAAAILALAGEAGSTVIDPAVYGDYIAGGTERRSTQEAMWTLLAANALIDRAGSDGFTVNGLPVSGPLVRVLADEAEAAPLDISNGSGRSEVMTLTTFGVPDVAPPPGGKGYAISRSYYTLKGDQADPAQVAQGTRLVAVVEVAPFARSEARLMVDDPLPAGFEIDNPNLMRGGDIRALDWLDVIEEPRNAEFRQDRFLAAVDWYSDKPFRLAYVIRATAPGSYHHPAASVEDMYRPDYRAWSAAGTVTVTE